MNKSLVFFVGILFAAQGAAMAAITVKKAAPVATKQAAVTDSAGSLIGTVLGLVSNVKELTQQQRNLTAECIPTTQELNFVNETVKEWAKTGAYTADEVQSALQMQRCLNQPSGGYQASVSIAQGLDDDGVICYDWFGGDANQDMVWYQFPMAVKASYCTDGSVSGCSEKNKQYVSNIYDVFNLIDFTEADYTANEATMAAKLIAKIENCSYAKLSAKKKALWGEFLVDTIGGLGQKTNTGAIMQTVGSVANTSGLGALQSLGSVATQFMDK
ncbi:MAG: hypothetical protein E7011_02470 [Alphaproteobacteria bacterium]|nr:hypothetical protein [Alphaproteobacteria bacterium]